MIAPALKNKVIYLHNIRSSLGVRNQIVLISRVLQIAIRRHNGMMLALFGPGAKRGLDFDRGVSAVELIDGGFQRRIDGALSRRGTSIKPSSFTGTGAIRSVSRTVVHI